MYLVWLEPATHRLLANPSTDWAMQSSQIWYIKYVKKSHFHCLFWKEHKELSHSPLICCIISKIHVNRSIVDSTFTYQQSSVQTTANKLLLKCINSYC